MGKEWIRLEGVGSLEIEQVLVTFDVPILFVCKNQRNQRFLSMCVDDEEGCYVIAETEPLELIKMLDNEMTMECVFRNAIHHILYITEFDYVNNVFCSKVEPANMVSEDLLPEKDAYFEMDNENSRQYKQKLRNGILHYSEEISQYYETKLEKSNKRGDAICNWG